MSDLAIALAGGLVGSIATATVGAARRIAAVPGDVAVTTSTPSNATTT